MAVTVLYYHRVGPPRAGLPRKGFVTPDAFQAQMRWIRRSGWTVLSLDDYAEALAGGKRTPRRGVVVTFDDGYADCLTYARPVLEAFGFSATFFVVAGAVGGTDRWNPTHGTHPERLAGWDDLRILHRAGFAVGSHTVRHRRLAELPVEEAREEVTASRVRLEEGLGAPVRHLAYPQGSWSAAVAAAVREAGYASACATRRGAVRDGRPDRFAIPRVPVSARDSVAAFAGKLVKGALGVYHWRARRRDGRAST
jgi:peptidoglycan/xylan/chitin deacetylase (PgdA/CDA1 family)